MVVTGTVWLFGESMCDRGARMVEDQEAYRRAKKRAVAKFGFYVHLTIYVVVNIVLVIVNLSTSPEYLWFKWPLLGWGIGLLSHALWVFVFFGKNAVTARMIERELKRDALTKR